MKRCDLGGSSVINVSFNLVEHSDAWGSGRSYIREDKIPGSLIKQEALLLLRVGCITRAMEDLVISVCRMSYSYEPCSCSLIL